MKRAEPETDDPAAALESPETEVFVNGNGNGNGNCSSGSNKRVKEIIVYTRKSKLKSGAVESSDRVKIGKARKPLCWLRSGQGGMVDVPIEDGVSAELAEIEGRGDANLFYGEGLDFGGGRKFGRMLKVEVVDNDDVDFSNEAVGGSVGVRDKVIVDLDAVSEEVVEDSVGVRDEVMRDLTVVSKEVAENSVGVWDEVIGDLSNLQDCVIEQSSNLKLSVVGESSNGREADSDMIVDGDATAELSTPQRNLELKMSKKIVLDKKPTTSRELLETGILEGVTVIYMGVKQSLGYGLHGTIKDDGILCWCSLCKGSNVISISQFEIHACNAYKRASQYICFENGKSLLDTLNACRDAPLHMLEATVQSYIRCSRVEKFLNCRKCKGSFAASSFANRSLMCNSCLEVKEPRSNSVGRPKMNFRFSKSRWISKSSRSTLARNSFNNKRRRKLKSESSRPVTVTKPVEIPSAATCSENTTHSRIPKKDQQSHNYVDGKGRLADGTAEADDALGKKLVEDYKEGDGIICYHCNQDVSSSQIEAHAGWSFSRNYVEELVRCDGCPRAFHKECASLPSIPLGAWYCKYCESVPQTEMSTEHNIDGVAAGRNAGVHPIEQVTQRCIRVVNNTEPEVNGCALCSCQDFSRSGFGPRTMIICDQCEQEYHVGCLREHKIAKLKEIPKGKWFCCLDCRRIHSTLSKLLVREAERIPDPLLTIVKKREKPGLEYVNGFDLRWKLLNGNIATPDSSVWLAETVAMFQESFDPIVDPMTGRDLIPSIVNGKSISGQEFDGLYCATLLVNSSVVSAGIIRIFGREVAELPLVATRRAYQSKGYFTLLFSCIEKLLTFLNVRFVVLPAAEEAESIWTEKFGFRKLNSDEVANFRKRFWQMVTFTGTCMLQRVVSGDSFISEPTVAKDSCSSV